MLLQNRHPPFGSPVPLWNPDGNGFLKRGLENLLRGAEGKIVHDKGFVGLAERCGNKQEESIRKLLRLDCRVS